MTTTVLMPRVNECSVTACSYNAGGCHAFAITVSGTNGGANCGTFVPLDAKGGLSTVVAQVGACSRADCVHNADLECTAEGIRVGSGTADRTAECLTYKPA